MVKVDNFCKNNLTAVQFKLFEGNMQKFLFPNRNDKRICLFGCSMISLWWWAKRLSFDFVDPMSTLDFGRGICMHLLAWSIFEKFAQIVDQTSEFSSGDIHFISEDITLLCLWIANSEQLDCKWFFVGASANSHYSKLGLGNVRNVVVKKSVNVSSGILCKMKKVCIKWEFVFWQTSTSFSQ